MDKTNIPDPQSPQKNGEATNLWSLIDKILTTRTALISLLLLTIGLMSAIYFLGRIGIKRIGDVIEFQDAKKKFILFNFSTSQRWEKIENYTFQRHQTLHFTASGRSNSAVHHLAKYGASDAFRIFPWACTNRCFDF
jgi:hypothetical protein